MWQKSGAIYDGDWREGERHGFGTLSVRKAGELVKEYAGGWKHDHRHVRHSLHTPNTHTHTHPLS